MTKDSSTKRPYKKSKHKKKTGKKKKEKEGKRNKIRAASKANKRFVEELQHRYNDVTTRHYIDNSKREYPSLYRKLIGQTMYLNGDVCDKKQTNSIMIIEQYVKDKIQEIVVSCLNSSTTYANGSSSKLDLQDILFHFRHNPQRVRRIYTFVKAKSEKIKSKRKEDIEFTKKRDVLGQHIPGPLTPAFLQRDALLNAFSEPKEDDDEEPLSSYSIIKPEDYFTNLSSEKNYTFTETDKKVMPKIRNKDTSDVVTQKFQGIYRLANPLHNSTMITSSSLHSEDTPLLPTPLSSTNDIFNMSLDLSNNSLLSTSTPTPSQNNDQKNPLVPRKSSFLENMYLVRDEDRQRKIALENLENDLSYHEYRKYHSQKALIYDYAEDQKTFKEWVRLDRLTHHGKNVKFSSVVIDALAFIAWEIASLVTQTSLIVQRSMHLMPSTIREHHLGQATGIMTQKVRSRLSFVPDESARKLAQSFASVASAPRHPPIIPAHVFEAIRRCQHFSEAIQNQPKVQLF